LLLFALVLVGLRVGQSRPWLGGIGPTRA